MTEQLTARLQDGPQGTTLTVDGQEHFVFRNKAAVNWLRDRCARGFHEPVMSQLLLQFMHRHPASVFLDIGALYGYFGLLGLAASKGRAEVYAFEMNPDSFIALEQNIAANALLPRERITAVHAAVGDLDAAAKETSYKGFILNSTDANARTAPLPFVTLDAWCRSQAVVPNLMKIDVEGYEGNILRGAPETLRSADLVILLELHSNAMLKASRTTRSEFLRDRLIDGQQVSYFGRHRADVLEGYVPLSLEYVEAHRDEIDAGNDDLVVLSRNDIRHYWPELKSTAP